MTLMPKHRWDDIKAFAEATARMTAATIRTTISRGCQRSGREKIFSIVFGTAAAPPRSRRSRQEPASAAPVAWPVNRRNLGKLESAHPVTIDNYADVLKRERTEPWKGNFDVDHTLPRENLRGR